MSAFKTNTNITYQLISLGSTISSTESDVNMHIGKIWSAIDGLMTIKKSDLSDKIKWKFFQAVAVLVQLNVCITWTWMKYSE